MAQDTITLDHNAVFKNWSLVYRDEEDVGNLALEATSHCHLHGGTYSETTGVTTDKHKWKWVIPDGNGQGSYALVINKQHNVFKNASLTMRIKGAPVFTSLQNALPEGFPPGGDTPYNTKYPRLVRWKGWLLQGALAAIAGSLVGILLRHWGLDV
jgi:hypothetical protein